MKIEDIENDTNLIEVKKTSKIKKEIVVEDKNIKMYRDMGLNCDPRNPAVWSNSDEDDWDEWDKIQENK